jgi:2-phosphosulfolactate phosphatase
MNKGSKIKADVIFSNNFDLDIYNPIIKNSICAVIDTLMAVSTITAIFGSNCKRIVLAREKNEAYLLKKILKDHYLLVGEENGIPPEGFDYGNRPLNFINMDLSTKKVILSTTNGSVSFFKLQGSNDVFAISLLNLDHALNIILNHALNNEKDILFLCSGRKGFITYDDIYTAGLAINNLNKLTDLELSDAARVACEIAGASNNALDSISNSESGNIVKKLDYLDDMIYCSKINEFNIVPRLTVLELNNNKDFHISAKFKNLYDVLSKSGKRYPYNTLLLLEPFNNMVENRKNDMGQVLKLYSKEEVLKNEKSTGTY